MNKQTWISLLVCVNLALLTGVIVAATSLPAANAQATGLSGNYLAVCGEVQDQFDALYLIDSQSKTLHAFSWDRGEKHLRYAQSRDLRRDFRNDRD